MKTMNSKLKKAGVETLTIMAAVLIASVSPMHREPGSKIK
jgi:hypothetical protein